MRIDNLANLTLLIMLRLGIQRRGGGEDGKANSFYVDFEDGKAKAEEPHTANE